MLIHRFISDYIASNTYVLEFEDQDNVILIDCGILSADSIIEWLTRNKKTPSHVFLTHADSDHVAGLNALQARYDFELRSTSYCAFAIKSSKLNFSKYIPFFNGGFNVMKDVIEVADDEMLTIFGYLVHFIHTPGHTKGCMCIKINEFLFTGDTIIKGIKTRINHRSGGSIIDLNNSMLKLNTLCDKNTLIYPGHGELIISFFEAEPIIN